MSPADRAREPRSRRERPAKPALTRSGIVEAALVILLAAVTVPAAGPWRDRVKALLTGYGNLLARYPGIARMAMSTQPSGPNYRALVEAILALLHEGGVADGAHGTWSKVRPLLSAAKPEYCRISHVEISLPDAGSRHPALAALVGPGVVFALSDGKGILGHGGSRLELGVSFRVPQDWLTAVGWTGPASPASPCSATPRT
jgi:hypothetical protein